MKGMIIKDIYLMRNQRSSILLMFALMIYFPLVTGDVSFLFPYLTILGCSMGFTTLTYDQFENGQSFLLTLPLTRKGYVRAKYLFLIGLGTSLLLACFILMNLLHAIAAAGLFQNTFLQGLTTSLLADYSGHYYIVETLACIIAEFLFIAFTTPFQLYFGREKGWITAMMCVSALIAAGVLICTTWDGTLKMQRILNPILCLINHPAILILLGMAVGILLLLLSIKLSIRIIEKKEF